MADDKKTPKGFISTGVGADTNKPITEEQDDVKQTPDQFFDPAREEAERMKDPPRNHATKGMTVLGYTEASRIENTAADEERERKRIERLAAKED